MRYRTQSHPCTLHSLAEIDSYAAKASKRDPDHDDDRQREYQLNFGTAVTTLKEELPEMFQKDFSYGIYR